LRSRLCRNFKKLPKKVWDTLSESNYYGYHRPSVGNIVRGIGFGEETITDILLLEAVKNNPYEILTFKSGRLYEGAAGSDWEWWIISKSGILGLSFQAKRLHFMNGNYIYDSLDYKPRSSRLRQVDMLINNALRLGNIPLYVFYNYWDFDYRNYINPDITDLTCCRVRSEKDLGVTIATAWDIHSLVHLTPSKKSLYDVLPVSYPIYSLTCCSFSDLTESISNFLTEIVFKEKDLKLKIHETLPKEVYLRLEGQDTESSPQFTSFIFDMKNPHEEIKELKSIFEKTQM